MNTLRLSIAAALATALALLTGCASGPMPLLGADAAAGCAALAGARIEPALIKVPSGAARIDRAEFMTPSPLVVAERAANPAAAITPAMPAFCKLLGHIEPLDPTAPAINFQVNLPAQWNGRSVQFGGGGFNGVLISGLGLPPAAPFDSASPLAQGYVTVGTDSGHQNKPGEPPQTFALNDEALVNFAHASYKKVHDTALALMHKAYGIGPRKQYFVGSSEGGREGLTMAQRYPADFDGIFSRVPVIHWTGLQHAGLRDGKALMNGGWLPPAKVKLVHDAVLAACDRLDGLNDGIVSDPVACRSAFDITALRCPGVESANCLSDAQVLAVQTLNSQLVMPQPLANGLQIYPGRGPSGEGLPATGPAGGWMAWWTGQAAPALPPQPSNGIAWFYGGGAIQYFYAQDPKADLLAYKPENHAARVKQISALMDSTNPDLSAFAARGGKLIVLENMADYAQSPYAGIGYVDSVTQRLGSERTASFLRLFTAPGVDHVGTGAPSQVDMLGALVAWVERGRAPADLWLAEQEPKPPFKTLRTRPLCTWPLLPRYIGGGDVNSAASFDCRP